MRSSKLNFFFSIGCLLLAALACNYSFTTANISSLKISKDKSASSEDSSFDSNSAIYIVAQVSNTSDKHKVTARVLYDDVKEQKSGDLVPGSETTVEVPGAAAATFTLTPPSSGWPGGKYKVEITMKDDSGKQVDQKTGSFSVSGASQSTSSDNANRSDSGATQSSVKLTNVILDSQMEGEPSSKTTFSPGDTIYVFYTIQGAPPSMKLYCNLYTENAEGFGPNELLRALSYSRPPNADVNERFDLDPKKEDAGQTIWASGTYRIELSYVTDTQTSPQNLKTIKLTVR